MDSWFFFPSIFATLSKDMPKVFYRHKELWLTLGRLFSKLKMKLGKARILASVVVETKKNQKIKIVFVRHRHKRQWLAILSTKIDLADEEIIRIYGKRWVIEVFFKMMKHSTSTSNEKPNCGTLTV